jgi:hypothetical protein
MPSLPYNPTDVNTSGLGCSRFARRYSGNRKKLLPEHNGAMHQVSRITPEHDAMHLFRKKFPYIAFYSSSY